MYIPTGWIFITNSCVSLSLSHFIFISIFALLRSKFRMRIIFSFSCELRTNFVDLLLSLSFPLYSYLSFRWLSGHKRNRPANPFLDVVCSNICLRYYIALRLKCEQANTIFSSLLRMWGRERVRKKRKAILSTSWNVHTRSSSIVISFFALVFFVNRWLIVEEKMPHKSTLLYSHEKKGEISLEMIVATYSNNFILHN